MRLVFTPWRKFRAFRDYAATWKFMMDVGSTGERIYKRRIRGGPKSGKRYGSHQASAPGEYPASRKGLLLRSVDSDVKIHRVALGTGMFYAKFLAEGTKHMAKRKMSRDAMQETLAITRGRMKPHMRFKHV